MRLTLIPAPYDSGTRDVRMGSGPLRLLSSDLPDELTAAGHTLGVADEPSVQSSSPANPVRSAFELIAAVAEAVQAAREEDSFPVVLSGNCNTMLGAIAAIGAGATAVFWLDAHGDFNTPETTTSGFFDGMALAILVGRCWSAMTEGVPGLEPVPEDRVALIGARDLDPLERRALERSAVSLLAPADLPTELSPTLDRIAGSAPDAYVHIDLDVLDPAYGRANELAAPGGLSPETIEEVVSAIGARFRIRGATLSAYDPAGDPQGEVPVVAARLLRAVLAAAASDEP